MNREVNRSEAYLDLVARRIRAIPLDGQPRQLYEPVHYCLENGGKRIRPVMTLMACELFGGKVEEALDPAVGLELFHNFTLLHDDVMDKAPVRRNKPTVHERWDVNTAILSGDVLFALASQYVARVPDRVLRPVIELYHQVVIEVCEGQQYDMDYELRSEVLLEEYIEMIRLKTAVLPAACMKTGAIIAGAAQEGQDAIYRFGELIGLAFQLRDDWLDVFGDRHQFGKQTGGDIIANKKTWLYIQALRQAGPRQKETLIRAYSGKISDDKEKVEKVKSVFQELGISDLALEAMHGYYQQALDVMVAIRQPAQRKQDLLDLAAYLLKREK